jgi:predicted porin
VDQLIIRPRWISTKPANFIETIHVKKNTLAALVLAAFAVSAHAQSGVTIYGLADMGVVQESGGAAGSITKAASGISGASRLGFRGTEDLGSGLSAIFVLEAGVAMDTGNLDNATSTLFNRQSYVGLKSKDAGTLTLGRQYTPLYNALSQVADPFGMGYAGTAKNLFPVAGAETRTSNTIVYATPAVSGFSADAAYSLGEQAGSTTAGRQVGASLIYSNGPLNARLAYNNRNNDTVTPAANRTSGRNTLFAANYDFKIAKAYFAYGVDKGLNSAPLNNSTANPYGTAFAPSLDSSDMLIGATAPVGAAGTLMASFILKNDKTSFNQDADQIGLGYSYALSKRTSVYGAYAKIVNKNGAGYTVGNNSDAGTGNRAIDIGLRHSF